MPVVKIPLAEWLPDLQSADNPGLEVADNVHAAPNGYEPFKGLTASGETVTGQVFGAQQMFDNSGNSVIVGGTSDRLFVRRSAITQTTGLTAIGASEAWDFARFNDYVIATGNSNAPQYLSDIDGSNTWVPLTGSPPNAKRCARVGDFLMLGSVAGTTAQIHWSHFNDPTAAWATSRLTQAGAATIFAHFGEIQRIVGGRYAIVFQQRGISRLSYVGPPQVFKPDIISDERGAVAAFGVVQLGYLAYFLAQDGFYVTNGSEVEPIGGQRVNKWFFDNVNQTKIKEVHGVVDWQNRSIIWAFADATSDAPNRLLIYNFIENKWTTATINVGWLVGSALDGTDWDSLDAIYGDLESITLPPDSDVFKGKDRRLAAFVTGASTSEYSTFTGTPLEATWQTGEFQASPGQDVFVSGVQPEMIADDWDATAQLTLRDRKGQASASLEKATGWDGFAPVRGEGQRVSVTMKKPAGEWTEATGMNVRTEGGGFSL